MPNGHRIVLHLDSRLRLTTLGGALLVSPEHDGTPAEVFGPGKPLALLVYLSFSPRRTATREHLIDLLWGDTDPERAAHALRQTVWQIRQTLGEKSLATHNGDLTLVIAFESDRNEFLAAVEAGALEEAVERYAGAFLPELAVPGGAEFEQWADLERVRLRAAFLRAAEALTRRHLTGGHVREAQRLARRARDTDPLNESGWRLLLEALIAGNDYVAATMEADALEHLLRTEEREPEPATRAAIRLARHAPSEPVMSNQLSLVAELVGREKEFASLVAAWDTARRGPARHVHVTAPPGLGKTRLLQDALARLRAGGARAVYVRANPGERHIPFAFAGDVAAAIARLPGATGVTSTIAATLVALNPALSGVYSAAPERRRGEDALRGRGIATAELLIAVAEEAPLCVLLDDLHWADQESRQVLNAALARVGSARLLVVAAARPTVDVAVPDDTTRLRLEPLSAGQTEALVGSIARLPDEPWARSLSERLHLSAGGSPLLILESLQLALEAGTLRIENHAWRCAEPLALAAQLAAGAALRHRIGQLDRTSQWLLVAMAVAGTPVSTASLATLVGRPEDAVSPVLNGLEVRGLATRTGGDWEPAHDEIADLALETAGPEAIRAARTGLGRALAAESAKHPGLALHAARHLAAGAEERPLVELAEWWVRQRHQNGDRRAPHDLVAELVGQDRNGPLAMRVTRRLPLRLRLGLDSAPRLAAAALATLALAGAAGIALSRPARRPLEASLLVGDTGRVVRVDLRQGDWQENDRFDIDGLGVPFRALEAGDLTTATPSPNGGMWVSSREFADSGDVDLVLTEANGARNRLTTSRGDDGGPSFSPDGRWLVFSTGRWDSLGHYALAVMDLASGRTRRLSSGEVSDVSARWSPDGTRIAFLRRYFDRRGSELCSITIDGTNLTCFRSEGVAVGVEGWADAGRIIVSEQWGGRPRLSVIDLSTRTTTVLATGAAQSQVSPDGRWIACLCASAAGGQAWSVFPTDRPSDIKPVFQKGMSARALAVRWAATGASRRYLERVRIRMPEFVPVGVPVRLRLTGADVAGNTVPVNEVRWRSADSSRAVVTADELNPRRTGPVTVIVSAGGWREDSVRTTIVPLFDSLLLREDWSAELDSHFIPYGSPRPELLSVGGGQLGFWNHGDGSFNSGAYSRTRFSAARGLGVETRVSVPLTQLQWQYIDLTFNASFDSAGLARWDHVSGSVPAPNTPRACGVGIPGGEGASSQQTVSTTSSGVSVNVPVPRSASNGTWHTVRVQIFPDGRCGTALDGKPLAIVDGVLPPDERYWLNISGKSVGTKVLVGPVEVWQGVRGGVDWSAAPR